MNRLFTFLGIWIVLGCGVNTALAQVVSIYRIENTPVVSVVGQVLKYRIDIEDAASVTGARLTWSTSGQRVDVTSTGTSGLFTFDWSTQTFTAAGLAGESDFYAAGWLTFRAISAGSGNLRVTGTLTTAHGTINVDTQIPITVQPPDPLNPLPAEGDFDFSSETTAEAPGWTSVGVLQRTELGLRNVVNVAACEVEISYDANMLGLMTANPRPGTTVVSARRGTLTLRGSWATPQSSNLAVATLLYTPLRGGETTVTTQGLLKNSPTDTPGTAVDSGFWVPIVDRQVTNIRVTPADGELAIRWNRVPGADAYVVRGYSQANLYPVEERVQAPAITVTLTGLSQNSEYTIWVSAEKDDRLYASARSGVKATPTSPKKVKATPTSPKEVTATPTPTLRSKSSNTETTITFANQTAAKIAYYWVDYEGNEKFYGNINPDASANQHTFGGHVWRIKTRNGQNLAVFRAVNRSMTFTASATRPPLYWIDATAGTLHRLIGTEVENLAPGFRNATNLAVDMTNGKLYWTEKTGKTTGQVRRANLNGTGVEAVKSLTSLPLDIALDTANNKIYLVNGWGKVQRMNFNGSNFQPNLIRDLDTPASLALDVSGGKLYWIEQTTETSGKIRRANLDGTDVELVKSLTSLPLDIALDTANNKIYLMNGWGKVQRMNFNGSNFQPNFITDVQVPGQVAVDLTGGNVYWTANGSLRYATLNSQDSQGVVTGLAGLSNIVLGREQTGAAVAAAPTTLPVVPAKTVLHANYPNPFNPETWIPYQLAKPAEVTVRIYAVNGALVRTLTLGHQTAGVYQSRSRAAYWDGKNALGESVASGVYFYTLSAGDFTATRKMLIWK